MIDFTYLFLTNFMSFKKASLPLADQGLVLIEGDNLDSDASDSNGSGKSSIIEALTWCLWGKTVRGVSKDEVVNDQTKKDCAVQIQFSVDSQEAKVTRFRKHSQFGNELKVEVDGQEFSEGIQETQKRIDKLLGCDFETFINAKYFSQGLLKRFTQSTDKEKKSIFDGILGLEKLESCRHVARSCLQNSIQEIDDLQHSIEDLNLKIEDEEERIASFEIEEEKFERKKQRELSQIKEDQKDVCRNIQELQKESKLKDSIEADLKRLKKQVDEVEEIQKKLDAARRIREELFKKEAAFDLEKRGCKKESNHLQEKLVKIENQEIDTPCPFCGRTLTASHLEKLKKEIQKDIEKLEKKVTDLKKGKVSLNQELDSANEKEDNVKEELEKAYRAEEKVGALKKESKAIERIEEKIEELKEKLLRLEERKKAKAKETSSLAELKQEAKRKIKKLKSLVKNSEKELKRQDDEKKYFEFWEFGFGNQGLKSFILDSILPTLNSKADYYSRILTGGELVVTFKTQSTLKSGEERERFSLAINQRGSERSYNASSAGEKRRVDLCVLLALQGLVASFVPHDLNILFFDEVFDALDKTGSEKVVDLLIEEGGSKGSIFVITHSEDLRNYFDNVVTVVKEGGVSKVS